MVDLKIGDKIRLKRKQSGMTLKELSSNRVTPAQISAIEKGKCKPSPDLLKFIAEKLNVDIEYFLLSDEEKYRKTFDKVRIKCNELYEKKKYKELLVVINESESYVSYLCDEQKGYYYYIQGNCAYDKGDYDKALGYYMRAITYFLMTSKKNDIITLYNKIGNCLIYTEQYEIAIGYYKSSYNYIDNSSDSYTVVRNLYNLSVAYMHTEKTNLAEEYITKAIDYTHNHDFKEKEALIPKLKLMEGIIQKNLHENEDGIKIFEEAFDKYKKKNDNSGMGYAVNNIAKCLLDNGETEKAIECLKQAIEYNKKANSKNIVIFYLNLAEVYDETGDMEKAFETINEAEEVIINMDLPESLIKLFLRKFEYLSKTNDFDKAENTAIYALEYINKLHDIKTEAKLYLKLSEMYKKMGDNKNSVEYLVKANKLA